MTHCKHNTCAELLVGQICCFTGVFFLLCLAHAIQTKAEDACEHPCCSKCLDEHCYEKTDREITGVHKPLTAWVAPILVNQV